MLNVQTVFGESLEKGVDPYLAWDNHLSGEGHRFVAVEIATYLQDQKSLTRQ